MHSVIWLDYNPVFSELAKKRAQELGHFEFHTSGKKDDLPALVAQVDPKWIIIVHSKEHKVSTSDLSLAQSCAARVLEVSYPEAQPKAGGEPLERLPCSPSDLVEEIWEILSRTT